MIANERGIALVITLLVVALLTITVFEFTYSVEVDNHMARNALNGLQAVLLARSGVNLGEAFLLHDEDPTVDAYTEDWGQIDNLNSQLVVPENMRLKVQIIDEGGKLNINLTRPRDKNEWIRLATAPDNDPAHQPQPLQSWRTALEHLFESRGVDPQVAPALYDYWNRLFDAAYPGQNPGSQGALIQGTPTQGAAVNPTPNAQLSSFDFPSLDDASIVGLSPSALRRLRPVLTALPYNQQPRVNVNTAPPEVLRAIVNDDATVDNILSQRTDTPIKQTDLGGLLNGLNQSVGATGSAPNFAGRMLGVISSYFLVRASAIVNPNPLTGRGGISRSASMLVRRDRRAAPPNVPTNSARWTLTQLDWQKEGGAVLFLQKSDQEPGSDDMGAPAQPGTGG